MIAPPSNGPFLVLESFIVCGALFFHFLADFIFYPYRMICDFTSDSTPEAIRVRMSIPERREADRDRMAKHIISYASIICAYWIVISMILVDFLAITSDTAKTLVGLVFFTAFVNAVSHGVIDLCISSARQKALIRQDCEKFWWLISLDQVLHISILTVTGIYFSHKMFYNILN